MKVEIGQIWHDKYNVPRIKVTEKTDDPNMYMVKWLDDGIVGALDLNTLNEWGYKLAPYYNTPLYKAINQG